VKANQALLPREKLTKKEMLQTPKVRYATILISKTGRNEVRELRP
jgi:hypothetical protein